MNSRGLIYFTLLFFLNTSLSAQQQNVPSAKQYFEIAIDYYFENIDSSIHYFQLGIPHYKEKQDWEKYINCFNALSALNDRKGRINDSYAYTKQAFEEAQKYLPKEGIAYSSALNNLATYERSKGNFEKALTLFNQALAAEENNDSPRDYSVLLANIGYCFEKKGDHFESRRYFQRAVNYGLKNLEQSDINITGNYIALASSYQYTNQLDTAIFLYQQVLERLQKYPLKEKNYGANTAMRTHLKLAELYSTLDQSDAFQKSVQAAINACKVAKSKEPEQAYSLLGKWAYAHEKFEQSINYFNTAITLADKSLGPQPHIGVYHFYLAQNFLQQGHYEKSFEQFQLALGQYAKDFTSPNPAINPAAEDLVIDQELLNILKGKAQALFQAHEQTRELSYLTASQSTFELAIQLLNKLRKSYLSSGSKELLSATVVPIFDGALATHFKSYQINPSIDLLEKILQTIENSKSILLLESINEIAARGIAGIPDSLLQAEKTLSLDIQFLQGKLVKAEQEQQANNIEEDLFALQKEHREIIELFEKNYPSYHQLKFNTALSSIQEIQHKLNTQAGLIQYYISQDAIYVIVVKKESANVHQLEKAADFELLVESLRGQLDTPPSSLEASDHYNTFAHQAHDLYNQLLAPLQLEKDLQELIILPHDILAYLPFEILLQKLPDLSTVDYSLDMMNYLIKDFQLSYNYSATLFCRTIENAGQFDQDFIGFAPSFKGVKAKDNVSLRSCTLDDLYSLDCTSTEVQQINDLLSGQAFLGKAANTAAFHQNIGQYRIAHFATHSCLDDKDPMNNKIFLSDGYISNYDLYNLQLPIELSVLSACQTGTGKLQRGEGVISLARGFIHAGCPSVLMSLWSVEDCSTSEIMYSYYEGLKAGLSKDQALSEAKLTFLQQANKLNAHPFYWAPFVQFGEAAPLDFKSKWTWWIWAGIMIAALLILRITVFKNANSAMD